jgi:hypothetical protein
MCPLSHKESIEAEALWQGVGRAAMPDAYETPFDRYDTSIDRDASAPCLEGRLDRLEARLDRLEAVIDRLEATIGRLDMMCNGLDRFGRTMRWGMIILTVLSLASTSLTVYLALQVVRSHGS